MIEYHFIPHGFFVTRCFNVGGTFVALFRCGAHGSVVLGVRPCPVTERSLVQTPLWSLHVVCCGIKHGTLSSFSQFIQFESGMCLELMICYGLVSYPREVYDSHPLSTIETGDEHQPYAPNGRILLFLNSKKNFNCVPKYLFRKFVA